MTARRAEIAAGIRGGWGLDHNNYSWYIVAMKPTLMFRPKRRDIQSPAKDVSAGTAAPAKSVTVRKPRPKPMAAVPGTAGHTSASFAPDGTLAAKVSGACAGLSDESVAKIAADVTKKAKGRTSVKKPQSSCQDMKALQTRLKSILSKSEAKALDKLFARLEKTRLANKKAQAAWRDRQKVK